MMQMLGGNMASAKLEKFANAYLSDRYPECLKP